MAASCKPQELLTRFIRGLELSDMNLRHMNFMERRLAIKQVADTAMASAADGAIWSRALINKISLLRGKKSAVTKRQYAFHCTSKSLCRTSCKHRKLKRRDDIYRRRLLSTRNLKSVEAKMVPKKQTKELKKLVPGGEYMDTLCLLSETAHYILSLKTQVYVMNYISNVLGSPTDQEIRSMMINNADFVNDNAKRDQ